MRYHRNWKTELQRLEAILMPFTEETSQAASEKRFKLQHPSPYSAREYGSVWIRRYANGRGARVCSTCRRGDLLCEAALGERHKLTGFSYNTWVLS